ncbi:MAG: winged helix-turn-helix domain-containing protein, partial [Stenotrophomonas sp.]
MISIENGTATADRIRIGDCTITISSREVMVDGARRVRRLTPKALGVLRVLMRVPGAVVTREELFAEVWPDTLPTNDVLTQAITQLRKAFSRDDEGGAAYIETIAKSGYRLLQPVTELVDTAPETATDAAPNEDERHALSAVFAAASAAPRTRPRSRWRRMRRYVLLAVGLGMVVALLVMTALLLQRPGQEPSGSGVLADGSRVVGSPQRPYRLITATSGFETYPTVSPDGSQVAYEADGTAHGGSTIKVQTSGNAPARALADTSPGHSDRFPSWSPNGREIAFARFGPGASCEVLIGSATGGALRHVTRCDGTELLSFDWTPDGRGLVFGSLSGRH